MPTTRYFQECPPFPSHLNIAQIPTIPFQAIEKAEKQASLDLFNACRHHGFFMVDLRQSHEAQSLLDHAAAIFDVSAKTFALGSNELANYAFHPPKDFFGYKKSGLMKAKDGTPDATEVYTLSQDEILGAAPAKEHPPPIAEHRDEISRFIREAHHVIVQLLGTLDGPLGLPAGTLADLTRLTDESDTSIRLILSHGFETTQPRVTIAPGHTDIGLITLLFNVVGGLQILPAGIEDVEDNWQYIEPKQGCVLVNIGDTLVELTGGVLRSALHRVVTPPGAQISMPRISLAYLARPPMSQSMRRLQSHGNEIPPVGAKEDMVGEYGDWSKQRGLQIIQGVLNPRTTGGISLPVA